MRARGQLKLAPDYDEASNPEVAAFLREQENKSMLRFLTCGSVDDGKSTLIGRLLYDTKLIFEDQLAALEKRQPQARHDRRGFRFRASGGWA